MLFAFFRRKIPTRPGCQSPAERQRELGRIAYTMLTWAATQNRSHGAVHPEAPALLVWRRPDNAGKYTIAVHLPDDAKPGHFFVLNFNVQVDKNEVHALWKRSGDEEKVPLEHFHRLLARACAHVQAWRLYPTTEDTTVA